MTRCRVTVAFLGYCASLTSLDSSEQRSLVGAALIPTATTPQVTSVQSIILTVDARLAQKPGPNISEAQTSPRSSGQDCKERSGYPGLRFCARTGNDYLLLVKLKEIWERDLKQVGFHGSLPSFFPL
jgi:hypothetical protein